MIKQFVNPNTSCIYTVGDFLGEDVIQTIELVDKETLRVTTNHNSFTQQLRGGEVYMDTEGETFMVKKWE